MDWSFPSVDGVASALAGVQARRAAMANTAMARGAANMQDKRWDLAVTDFKRAIGNDPTRLDAYRLLASTYAAAGQLDEAVRTYRQALQRDPTFVEARNDLAKLLMTHQRYAEAETEYKRVISAEPASAGAIASLGYIYLHTGRALEAERTFERVLRLEPQDAAAHYSLGLARHARGNDEGAVESYTRAIELRPTYAAARADLATAYLALGRKDDAREEVNELFRLNTLESVLLAQEVARAIVTPRIAYLDITRSTFNPLLGPGTEVADLDPALATPGAMITMTMTFEFNQEMDLASVQNVLNWSIRRAQGGEAGVYNNGVTLDPSRDVTIGPIPTKVVYDPVHKRATVHFRVSQNALGNGLMDPKHWVFKFGGVDANGRAMDPGGDEFDWYAARSF